MKCPYLSCCEIFSAMTARVSAAKNKCACAYLSVHQHEYIGKFGQLNCRKQYLELSVRQ